MVEVQLQDTHYTCDNLHVSAAMRPSSSNIDNTILSSDSNLINDTCVSNVSFSDADISVNNQTPAEQEGSCSDCSLSPGGDMSTDFSVQGSDNTFITVNDLSNNTGSDQSHPNHLLDLGLRCKGFCMGHLKQ